MAMEVYKYYLVIDIEVHMLHIVGHGKHVINNTHIHMYGRPASAFCDPNLVRIPRRVYPLCCA